MGTLNIQLVQLKQPQPERKWQGAGRFLGIEDSVHSVCPTLCTMVLRLGSCTYFDDILSDKLITVILRKCVKDLNFQHDGQWFSVDFQGPSKIQFGFQ